MSDNDADDPVIACWNCGDTFHASEMEYAYPHIPHLWERMEPGDRVPAGECPNPDCRMCVFESDVEETDETHAPDILPTAWDRVLAADANEEDS